MKSIPTIWKIIPRCSFDVYSENSVLLPSLKKMVKYFLRFQRTYLTRIFTLSHLLLFITTLKYNKFKIQRFKIKFSSIIIILKQSQMVRRTLFVDLILASLEIQQLFFLEIFGFERHRFRLSQQLCYQLRATPQNIQLHKVLLRCSQMC